MRKFLSSLTLVTLLSLAAWTQATPAKKATPAVPASASKPAAQKSTAAKPAAKAAPAKPAPSQDPIAIFDTTAGKLTCTLFAKQAPKTVENFIGLATGTKEWTDSAKGAVVKGRPLYDNTIFHRVIPNFMIQGGDPLGNGTGNPGYRFEDEFVPELRFDKPGLLAMANAGPGTNGSQFFITEVPTPHLNDRHTIFGACDDASVELVKSIARVATDPRNNKPDQDIRIKHITIVGGPKGATPAKRAVPATPAKPAVKASSPAAKPATKAPAKAPAKASTPTKQ